MFFPAVCRASTLYCTLCPLLYILEEILIGLDSGDWPDSGIGLRASSSPNMSLPLQGRQPLLAHLKPLAHGLLVPRSSTRVCPPHLSTNWTPGDLRHSPRVSSTCWRFFLSLDSLVYGINTGVFTTFTFSWALGQIYTNHFIPIAKTFLHIFTNLPLIPTFNILQKKHRTLHN